MQKKICLFAVITLPIHNIRHIRYNEKVGQTFVKEEAACVHCSY
ncbi:hypothetical protein B4168_2858 [Anoxybacillus flavithermus]|nr:hypothetical protein B4168_2858 [Anoxybacillus flavithermus]OAO84914.1 hypothetical protein GT23_3300 [Parageobacillus thermoglucosidasius]